MRFDNVSKVTHPAQGVLELMIERMEEIVPFLPSVESIETLEMDRRDDGTVRVVRRWQGTADTVPRAVRPFLKKEHMAWTDTALWHPDEFAVDFELTTNLSRLYECKGRNVYGPHPDDPEGATKIEIQGDLNVYPDKLPGVPKWMGRKLAPQIERFVVGLVTPNVIEVSAGLQRYFDAQAGDDRG